MKAKKTKRCKECRGTGVMFFLYMKEGTSTRLIRRAAIQRCDTCCKHKDDWAASRAAQRKLRLYDKIMEVKP